MKTVILEELELNNFKNTKHLHLVFDPKNNTIRGRNRSGKTTIFDAYLWLLYGKNSEGETDFDIKTLDQNNEPIHKLTHSVRAKFSIDGNYIELQRVYTEKWVKPHGEEKEELKTHDTKYFVNNVPKTKSEYAEVVSGIIQEDLARIISDNFHFNKKMKWNERREILLKLVGEISDKSIIETNNNLEHVISMINEGKDISEEKKGIAAAIKKIKEDAEGIPFRISETHETMPESLDWTAIEDEMAAYLKKLEETNSAIDNLASSVSEQAEKAAKIQAEKAEIKFKLSQLSDVNSQESIERLSLKRSELSKFTSDIAEIDDYVNSQKRSLLNISTKREVLRNKYKRIQSSIFDKAAINVACPSCLREYGDSEIKIAEAEQTFNSNKAKELNEINIEGTALKTEFEAIEAEIIKKEEEKAAITKCLEAIKLEVTSWTQPKPTEEMIMLEKQIESIVVPVVTVPDTTELKEVKANIESKIQELRNQLNVRNQINEKKARIEDLTNKQRLYANEISKLEKTEHQIDVFERAKMDVVEQRVNKLFSLVKFKMFEKQMNGKFADTCECMINGVPFKSLNTEGKVNAGLDIINTLQHSFEIFAPVWIDNRESTTSIIDLSCQTISLFVDPEKNIPELLHV